MKEASEYVGLNLFYLRKEFKKISEETNKISQEYLNKLMNFEGDESELNYLLDKGLKFALAHDMRGPFIDTLLALKEKRDELIEKLFNNNYKEEAEGEIEEQNDPFWYLDADLEYLVVKNPENYKNLNFNFIMHTLKINYFELCSTKQNQLEEYMKLTNERLESEDDFYISNIYNRYLKHFFYIFL